MSDASQNDDRLVIEIFRPAAKAWFRPEIEKLFNDPTTYLRPLAQAQCPLAKAQCALPAAVAPPQVGNRHRRRPPR